MRGRAPNREPRLAKQLILAGWLLSSMGCSGEEASSGLVNEQEPVPGVSVASLRETSNTVQRIVVREPACAPVLKDGQWSIRDTPLNGNLGKDDEVSVFALDPEHILLARKHRWDKEPMGPAKGTLWRVSCAQPALTDAFYQRAASDFGHAALSSDHHALFFSSREGIKRLFLATKTVQSVTDAPNVGDTCWTYGEEGFVQTLTDIVQSLNPKLNLLNFERGGPCGVMGTWTARPWQLAVGKDSVNAPPMRSPRPFSTLTRDVSGQLWVGDGGRCDQPGLLDLQTPGVIFVSRNDGVDWEAVKIQVGAASAHTGVRSVRSDRKRAGHLIVHTARCTNPLGTYGGLLYMTRDAGRHWSRVPIESAAGYPSDGGTGVVDFTLIEDSIDSIRVWNDKGETHVTRTTGSTWQKENLCLDPKL